MDTSLTDNAVPLLSIAGDNEDQQISEPVLQVLNIKKVNAQPGTPDRYRLVISDGVHYIQAMLSTSLNHLVASDPPELDKNHFIKLLTYATNVVGNRRIVIILTVEVLENPGERIGSPAAWDNTVTTQTNGPSASTTGDDVVMQDVKPSTKPAVAAATPVKKAGGAGGAIKKNGSAGGGALANGHIYPIEGLSPYQNKWTIKARCTVKSEIKHWSNAKGEGKLFSVNLLDDTGEIKATGFNDEVDKLYPIFEEGKVFYISKARVNIAKKQFSNLSNEYEISFGRDTDVELCEDQDSAPQIKYNFVELSHLSELEKDATVDVLGIVTENGTLAEITTKAAKQLKKRDLTIADRSGFNCRLTLWGKTAENWQDTDNGVFAFKGVRVGDFNGRTLSMGGGATVVANPDIPEAHDLKGWYDVEGSGKTFASHSGGAISGGSFKKEDFKTLDEVKNDDSLGMSEKPDFFAARATIILIKAENMWYPACPSQGCNKKVSMESDDQWRCEKCDRVYEGPEYRYIMSMCVGDYTNQIWINGFNDVGVQVLGRSADDMQRLREEDESSFTKALSDASGKMYEFTLRAKAETYNDNTRVKYSVQRINPVDWVTAAKNMLADIQSYGL
ncbi:replication factor A 1, rfa1 [Meredithblackwellia eburnea MCA 4105]